MEAVQVFRRDFDYMENNIGSAISDKLIGTFVGNSTYSAQGVAAKFISDLPAEKVHLGWDKQVYPQIYIKTIQITT